MSEEQEVEVEEEVIEERNFEEEAKVLGWHNPEDEDFKGDAENALSAEDFVKRGEEILPIVNANNKKLMKEIQTRDEKFDREKAEFKKHMDATLKRERDEHEKKLEEAVGDGDVERYKELKKTEPQELEKTEKSPIESEFESRHDWYGTDDKRTKLAQAADNSIQALRSVLTASEYVDRIEQEMERLMPTKQSHNTVTGGRKKLAGKKSNTFESMPKENQAACKDMEKNNWGIKREDYVKNYWAGASHE